MYSSTSKPRRWRSRLRRRLALSAVVLIVLGAVAVGGLLATQAVYFIGTDANGQVTVYNGIPSTMLGFRLAHVAESTELSASRAERLQPYADLAQGITADSRQDAEGIVRQIRQDLRSNVQVP